MAVISNFDIWAELEACNAPAGSIRQVELRYHPSEEVDGEIEAACYNVTFFCLDSYPGAYYIDGCAAIYDMAEAMKAYNAVVEAARANLDSEQRREARESKFRDRDE